MATTMGAHTVRISEFYAGKNVFVTGATGFMGKVLVEKLLRSCPDIGTIYALVRPKKGRGLEERLQTMTEDAVYDRLKKEQPQALEKKLFAIKGDCSQLNLGMSEEDRELIKRQVNIIFHVAASVRFDDPLKDAILLNTRGTREVAQLALDIHNLTVLVHVSTTYCNCQRTSVSEHVYPAPADWRQAIAVAEGADPDTLSLLTQPYLDNFPNTYTFTKALGEHVVRDICAGKVPLKIARPSIVISSLKEPVEGWIDNFNGPVGLLIACGKGIMRTSYQHPDIAADYIPVDIAIKIIIVAAWDLGLRGELGDAEVVHCSSGYHKWVTIGSLIKMGRSFSREIPLNDIVWVPKGYVTTSRLHAYVKTVLFQLLPAFFLDLCLKAAGKKPILTKLQQRIYTACMTLRYFTFQEWRFENDNMLQLEDRVRPEDKEDWDYDTRHYDVELYIKKCILGSRRYLLKESDDTLPAARIRYVRMLWLDRVVSALFYIVLVWIAYKLDVLNWFFGGVRDTYNAYFTLE